MMSLGDFGSAEVYPPELWRYVGPDPRLCPRHLRLMFDALHKTSVDASLQISHIYCK